MTKTTISKPLLGAILAISALFVIGQGTDAYAAIYAKYDSIAGESTYKVNWTDIESVSWGFNPDAKPSEQSIYFSTTSLVDKSSPKLMEKAANGEEIIRMDVEFTRPNSSSGQDEIYLIYRLANVVVTDFEVSDDPAMFTANYSFSFMDIIYETPGGQVTATITP